MFRYWFPSNRQYIEMANHVQDSDGDGLLDATEELVLGTRADTDDSDGDGLSDYDEIMIYRTDALVNDMDQDWVLDGYEIDHGTNPTDPNDTPHLRMLVNNGSLYTANTALSLTFPGLAADSVELREVTYSNHYTSTHTLASSVFYPLQSDQGEHRILRAIPKRNNGQEERSSIHGSVYLDTTDPSLTISSPTNGLITSRAWINIEGTMVDTIQYEEFASYTNHLTGPAKVLVNGKRANRRTPQDGFIYDRYPLQPGTNFIAVSASDRCGNTTTYNLQVVQDTSSDTTAPTADLEIPANPATYGDSENLYIHGLMDDETASVSYLVVSGTQTNGPYNAAAMETTHWGQVGLFPGANTLSVKATDAAGNSSTNQYNVVRDTNFFFEITSPTPYQVLNSTSVTVHGRASSDFLGNSILVNGQPA
ncbi:MAG: hypothetical protein GY703_01385, partial [Gammaproteobacteria bacterium]|nr:hypothetical protein [Gammaproteobacteria bacterium]